MVAHALRCTVHAGEQQVTAVVPIVEELRQRYGLAFDMTLSMSWFLSRTVLWGNEPIVVIVEQGGQPVAAVLLSGRKQFGFPTGVVKAGNGSGDGVVVAPAALRASALAAAIARVLATPWIHTFLISVRGVAGINGGLPVTAVRQTWRVRPVGTSLSLDGGFEGFLSRLRPRSRRNYRYFRRRAEKEIGASFLPQLEPDEAVQAVQMLQGVAMHPVPYVRAMRFEAAIRATPGYFAMGVRSGNGQWLSYLSGWRQPEGTFVEWQLNHKEFKAHSLSTVMRTYLIEHEAAFGVPQIVFVGGTSQALGRYCAPEQCFDILATREGVRGFLVRYFVPRLRPQSQIALVMGGGELPNLPNGALAGSEGPSLRKHTVRNENTGQIQAISVGNE